jgi:hypothetical protein
MLSIANLTRNEENLQAPEEDANAPWALGDFDYNGFVDDDDVTLLGAFYDPFAASLAPPAEPGASGRAAFVPEPSALGLAGCSLLLAGVAVRRRK